MGKFRSLVFGACMALVGLVLGFSFHDYWTFYQMTGAWMPIHKVDQLNSPIRVLGWNASGLQLAGGRNLSIPNVLNLPVDSVVLKEATRRGVEIDAHGQVWGLVKIWHSCGNDPVVEEVERVNLADLCAYMHVGELTLPMAMAKYSPIEKNAGFDEQGWSEGGFEMFRMWANLQSP